MKMLRGLLLFGCLWQVCLGHWPGFITDNKIMKRSSSEDEKFAKSRDELLHEILRDQHPLTTEETLTLEDFLWTGSGDYDSDDYIQRLDDNSSNDNSQQNVSPTRGYETIEPSSLTQPNEDSKSTPSYPPFINPLTGEKLPNEEFLVRTILLSNMTIIHNGIENFKTEMENKLTEAYRHAYVVKRYKRNTGKRIYDQNHKVRLIRSAQEQDDRETGEASENRAGQSELPRVKIHNIRSSLPEPEIEMIYTVSKHNKLVPAQTAVEALCNVDDNEVSEVLGFPLITKAEPYRARAEALVEKATFQTNWLIAAVVMAALLAILVILALLFLLHKYKVERNLHSRLLGSPGGSSSPSGVSGDSPICGGTLEKQSFGLAKPSTTNGSSNIGKLEFLASGNGIGLPSKDSASKKTKNELLSSGEDLFRPQYSLSHNSSIMGEESPSLADLSSNNTPEMATKRSKKSAKKSHKPRPKTRKSSSPGLDSEVNQSVFPVRTPDKEGFIGPLNDLLEEEITLPGESREHSAPGTKNWAYLPKSRTSSHSSSSSSLSSICQRDEVDETPEISPTAPGVYSVPETSLSPSDPRPSSPDMKDRAFSAKSHIFRKGKVEAARSPIPKSSQSRPWSAHESRMQADPIFAMRQRHWEGLIAGKKKLHRGQLLPGSTSEEELKDQLKPKAQPCWSECTSPRKQVRIQEPLPRNKDTTSSDNCKSDDQDPPQEEPIIKAIKDELQKFQRPKSPGNLAGISVINEPQEGPSSSQAEN